MEHEEKINNMRIAAGVASFGFTNKQLDLLVSLYDLVTLMQGKTTIKDIVEIESQVDRREQEKKQKELQKKVELELRNNEKKMD